MENLWSSHHLKAAEHAQKAAFHFKRAANFYDLGDHEKAIHHALSAITHIDRSSEHAQSANEFCFNSMINDMLES